MVGRVVHRRAANGDCVATDHAHQAAVAVRAHGHGGGAAVGLRHTRAAGQCDAQGGDVGRGGAAGAAQLIVAGCAAIGAVGQAVADGRDRLAIRLGLVGKAGCAVVKYQCFATHSGADVAPVGDGDIGATVIDLVAGRQAAHSERLGCDGGGGCHAGCAQGVVGGS